VDECRDLRKKAGLSPPPPNCSFYKYESMSLGPACDCVSWSHGGSCTEPVILHWLESQDAYFKWRKKRNTGAVWASSVISELWSFAWRIWEHRNDIVHDPGDGLARRTLLREVEEEKALGGRYLPQTARALFRKSMDYLKKAQSDYLENWLRRIRAARALAEAGVEEIRPRRRRKRALATDQQLITRFIRRRVDVSHLPAMENQQQQSAPRAQQPQRARKKIGLTPTRPSLSCLTCRSRRRV
jgi:hypothetical protein